jgi:hypothetical protein
MLISVSLLKQSRDGVMGFVAKCEWADDLKSNYWKRLIPKYHREPARRPIPRSPYVEMGNAGERVLSLFEPGERERVAIATGRPPVGFAEVYQSAGDESVCFDTLS